MCHSRYMKNEKHKLELKRDGIIDEIKELIPWMEGTVVSTSKLCGKKNCVCLTEGKRHPVLYITRKVSGKTVTTHLPRTMESKVRQWTQNYKKLKDLIRDVSALQRQLLRMRDDK